MMGKSLFITNEPHREKTGLLPLFSAYVKRWFSHDKAQL